MQHDKPHYSQKQNGSRYYTDKENLSIMKDAEYHCSFSKKFFYYLVFILQRITGTYLHDMNDEK